jgi:hypothetical protein
MSNLQNADIGSDVEYQQKQRSRTEQNSGGKDQGRPQGSESGEHIDPANKKPQKEPESASDPESSSPEPLSKVQQQPGVGEVAKDQP